MSEPEFSDGESTGFISELYNAGYSDCDDNANNNENDIDMDGEVEVEIDMDGEVDVDSKPIKKPIIITKRHANLQSSSTRQTSTDNKYDARIKKSESKAEGVKNEPRRITKKTGVETKKDDTNEKETKESTTDAKFQFNEETIEYFSKDILDDVKKICVMNSSFNNETALLCLLLKLKIIKEYKCAIKKCKTGKTWLGKPIQLLVHRKNGKWHDLTTGNLELICPNCYIAAYGVDLFIKVIATTIYKCTYCGFPLNNFSNSKKKERICMACESRIVSSSYFGKRSEYINELKDTIDESSQLKKDEFTHSNYYSEVSRYKSFDNGAKKDAKSSNTTFNDKPIINLNLSVPTIDELINDVIAN